MKLKTIYKSILPAMLFVPMVQCMTSCSDAWDNHYDQAEANGTQSLLQLVESNPELSDFLKLLKVTHVYNNTKRTNVTYAELLDNDQTLTVWAPVNGTFNADSLLNLCQSEQGDSTVSHHFVRNHIAHNLYNMNSQTADKVKMLNDKTLDLSSSALYKSAVVSGKYNLPATNGLLHVVSNDVDYTYNIYEGLTSLPELSHLGSFFSTFERQELDEKLSIQAGIEDGKKIYSDSVMVKENILFRTFDQIISEDSNFVMMVPSAEIWEPVKAYAQKYFNYGSIEKADSISNYWTNICLMQDLIWNKNVQRSLTDSLFTTSYNRGEWPYHVYRNPFSTGGYLDSSNIKDTINCSNGEMYRLNNWPFTPEQLYFHPIFTEGEREANLISYKDCTLNYRQTSNKNVSGGGYLDIVPKTSTSNWTANFEIRNTLSGTYDICITTLPKTVYLSNSRDKKPNKFTAVLHYTDENGRPQTVNYKTEMTNDGENIDTVVIGRFTFPVCNYKQQDATVSLELKCSITSRQTTYSREMYLDCITLRPVTEEESEATEAKSRKEARK